MSGLKICIQLLHCLSDYGHRYKGGHIRGSGNQLPQELLTLREALAPKGAFLQRCEDSMT